MNKGQSLTWELLIIIGVILVIISPIGDWLAGIVQEIATKHDFKLNFNPLSQGNSTFNSANQSAGGGGGSGLVGHYTVNLAGGGQMTVNANSQAAAVENVKAEGGTPA